MKNKPIINKEKKGIVKGSKHKANRVPKKREKKQMYISFEKLVFKNLIMIWE